MLPWYQTQAFHGHRDLTITVHPASLQAFRLVQTRVCEQLPVPKSKRGAEGSLELGFEGVNDCGVFYVNQPQKARFVVKQDAYAVWLAHQRHRNYLIAGHDKPLALSVAEHPGGAVGAHAVVSGHQRLGHTQTKLLRLFDRHLPVVSSAADLLIAKHDGPVSETFGGVLHVAGVQTQHAVDDASVFLEEVQAAVSRSLIEPKLKIYREQEEKNPIYFHDDIQFDI